MLTEIILIIFFKFPGGPIIPIGAKIEDVTLSVTTCNPLCVVPRNGRLGLQLSLLSSEVSVPLLDLKAASADTNVRPQMLPNSTFLANKLNVTAVGTDKFRVGIEVDLAVPKMSNNTGRIQWNLIKGNEISICIETPVIFKD